MERQEDQQSDPETPVTLQTGESPHNNGDTIQVMTRSPAMTIGLTRLLSRLQKDHVEWICADPRKADFDDRIIKIRMIEDLLAVGETNLDRISGRINDRYGRNLPRERLEKARDEVLAELAKVH